MTNRADEVASHDVWAKLEAADEAVAESNKSKSTPETARSVLVRVRRVVERARFLLDAADADFVNIQDLTDMSAQLTNVASWVGSCAAGSDVSINIALALDEISARLSRLTGAAPFTNKTSNAATFMGVLKKESEGVTSDLSVRAGVVRADLDVASAQVDQLAVTVLTLSEELAATRVESRTLAEQARVEMDTQKTVALTQIETESTDLFEELRRGADEALVRFGSDTSESLTAGTAILNRLQTLAEEVDATAKAVGDRVLSGDYGIHAGAERDAANQLRLTAIVALVGAVGFAVWASVSASRGDITWQRLVAKVLATLVFSGVGGYLASQSKEHREEERMARRRHLDLKALGPFIVDLSPDKQEAIRAELARTTFLAQAEQPPAARSPRRGLSVEQIKSIVEVITAARK